MKQNTKTHHGANVTTASGGMESSDVTIVPINHLSKSQNLNLLQSIIENSPDLLAVIDENRNFSFLSKILTEALGYQPDSLIGKSCFELIHEDDITKFANFLELQIEQPTSSRKIQIRLQHLNLTWRMFEIKACCDTQNFNLILNLREISNDADEHCKFSGFIEDNTEKRQFENLLRQSESKFKAIFEKSPIGIVQVDLNGFFVDTNPAFQKMLGYSATELLKMKIPDISHPDDLKNSINLLKELASKECEWFQVQKRYFHKNGNIVWGQVSATLIDDSKNERRLVLGMIEDVSHRKQVESKLSGYREHLEKSTAALTESEAKYRSLFENMNDGFSYNKIILDRNGKPIDFIFLTVNKAFEKYTGLKKQDVIEKRVSEVIPDIRNITPDLIDIYGKVAKTGKSANFEMYFENFKRWHHISVYSPSQNHFCCVFEDITNHKHAVSALLNEIKFSDSLIDSLPGVFFLIDENGHFERWNKNFEKITGFTINEIPKKNPLTFFKREDKTRVEKQFKEVFKNGKSMVEAHLVSKSGKEHPYLFTGTRVKNDDHSFLLGLGMDTSEREEAARKIAERENQLSLALSSANAGTFNLDIEKNYLEWDERSCNMFGTSKETFGHTFEAWQKLVDPDDLRKILPIIYEKLRSRTEQILQIEYRIIKPNGSEGYIFASAFIDRKENKQPYRLYGFHLDYSDKKQAEQDRDRFFETALAMLCTASMDGYFTRLNPSWEQILGWKNEELMARPFLEFVHPDDVYSTLQELKKLSVGVTTLNFTNRYRCKNGSYRWLNWISVPHANTIYGSALDITELKVKETILIESEKRFRTVFDNSPLGKITIHKNGAITNANHAFSEILGYCREEILNSRIFRFVYAGDQEKFNHEFSMLAENGAQRISFDAQLQKKSGEPVWCHFLGTMVKDPSTREAFFLTTIEDISERRKALQDLAESEENLKFALSSAGAGTFLWDIKNNKNHWSDRTLEIFGLTREEFRGKYEDWWDLLHPEDKKIVQINLPKILNNPKEYDYSIVHRAIRPDGKQIYIQLKSFIMRDDSGGALKISGLVFDITTEKEAVNKLNDALKELKRSNKELEQFAYVASHDLQEPLRKVKNFAELFKERFGAQIDERADKYIYYMVDGATRMQSLISDLLLYSRVNTRKKPFEMTDINLVIEDVIGILELTINETNARITFDPLPTIFADSSQLVQVFQNLLSNAIKFRGMEQPQVHISAEESKEEWIFSVRDNGIGIESQYADRIFQIFQQLHSKNEYTGTGIGLAICKKIVERHGGQIWFESELNQGTTFFFSISNQIKIISDNTEN